MMKPRTWIAVALLVCIAGIFAFISSPPGTGAGAAGEIVVEKGMSLRDVSLLLKKRGLIRSTSGFELTGKLLGAEKDIKAGGYKISSPMNTIRLVMMLKKGAARSGDCFTIPGGKTAKQVGALLAEKGYVNEARFGELVDDAGFAGSAGIGAPGLEGYLFPETYCIGKGASEEDIIGFVAGEFHRNISVEDRERADRLGLGLHKIVILASIIEKEASEPGEKPLVSAVFHNRLKAGMLLQSCATVIYALGDRFTGELSRDDLGVLSDYNTYLHAGLPPAPVCSPGLDSIKAALYPARVDYLYFVSMNNGKHHFSSTLNEHNRAVKTYQVYPR